MKEQQQKKTFTRTRQRGGRSERRQEEKKYEQRIVEVARVTRVVKGGKRMRFRVCVVIGDQKGKVALGIAKGQDVAETIGKATARAEKEMSTVSLVNETIPHRIETKFGAAKVMLKPAARGTGVRAGGVMRTMCELAGIPNIVGKMMGSKNKINNARAMMLAFTKLRTRTDHSNRTSERQEENAPSPII